MKVLLLGAGGLMGRHLRREILVRGIALTALEHSDLDVTDREKSLDALGSVKPDVVINAAALCNFSACEADPDSSRRINLEAPQWWSGQCEKAGIRFVHYSSDYIFDGKSGVPYKESDNPNPLCVYGGHKAELERTLTKQAHALVLRVAWIFGAQGKTFMSILPSLLMGKERLSVASGKRGSCLHAATGAKATLDLINAGAAGVVNLAHEGETSWEAFADFVLEELHQRELKPHCGGFDRVPFQEIFSSGGSRPDYSVLDVSYAESLLGYPLPDWKSGVRAYLDEIQATLCGSKKIPAGGSCTLS